MPDAEFSSRRRQLRLFAASAASAVSVVAVVVAAALVVHPWRDAAARSPETPATGPATSLASSFASTVSSASAGVVSAPESSSVPVVSSAPTNSPPDQPSPHPSATTHHTSPGAPAVVDESHLNFQVTMRLSPTHLVLGQHTRVTVTILNAGHGVDPPAEVSIGAMVPVDEFSDAPSDCTIGNGGIECPVPVLQAGREKTIAFTVTTAYYPGDAWDDEIYGQLNYVDSYGQQQQLPPGYSADLFVTAGTPSSSPPTSDAPSTATPTASPAG